MGIKKYKPYTKSRRWITSSDYQEITKGKPEKSLLLPKKRRGGRNVHGRVTVRHRGGGHKRMVRVIDFKRDKRDIPAKVLAIEYDPNRSSRIALLEYADGERRYIIAPLDLRVNDEVISAVNAEVKPGNNTPLRNIPAGMFIHNVELLPGKGAQIARSAGGFAQIMAKEEKFAHVKLPSGEIRLIGLDCWASIGQVGNPEHEAVSHGKAGRSRWLGVRPGARGVAMNPIDHPLGGGEGKSAGGRHPSTPWGTITKGYKTRKKRKSSDRYIVKRRK